MFNAGTEIGQVFVQTTDNREHTVEEIAERAVNRAIRVDTQEGLKQVLIKYLEEAQRSERANVRRFLIQNGFDDAAKRLEEE
jgi:hypothetical protein